MRTVRFKRWLIPTTVSILAGLGIVFLLLLELDEELPLEPTRRSGQVSESLAQPPAWPAESEPSQAPASTWEPASSTALEPVDPASVPRSKAPRTWALPAPQLPPAREPRAATVAARQVAQLGRAKDIRERLRLIHGYRASLGDEQAAVVLNDLANATIPVDGREASNLRLAALAQLGDIPGSETTKMLLSHLSPDTPRAQRLIALRKLAKRPQARQMVQAIAKEDGDPLMQRTARQLLKR